MFVIIEQSVKDRGSYPFLNKKFKDFSRTFKDTFPKDSRQCKKEPMSFLVLPQNKKFYPEGLPVFAPFSLGFYLNYGVSIAVPGLSSTDCNFQGLSKPSIFILKFKDFKVCANPVRSKYDKFITIIKQWPCTSLKRQNFSVPLCRTSLVLGIGSTVNFLRPLFTQNALVSQM